MSDKKTYTSFNQHGCKFTGNNNSEVVNFLPPSFYEVGFDEQRGVIFFNQFENIHDDLMVIDTPEYETVVGQINRFLLPETKKSFKEYGFIYKRSSLIYGDPGTGKTCLVNLVADHVKELGGIVLFNPLPGLLQTALKIIRDVQPDTTVLVIFEELDKLMQASEGELLSLLDGECQADNIIYLATTNFIKQIPARVCRPGRFSNIIEVLPPNKCAREYYLKHKLKPEEVSEYVEKTEGFTIDELKELVLATKCLGEPIDIIVDSIRKVKSEHGSGDIRKDVDPYKKAPDKRKGFTLWGFPSITTSYDND